MRSVHAIVVACVAVGFCASRLLADAKVEEQVVGPVGQGITYLISPKGVRLATVAAKGSRVVVIVDGVEGPVLDQMLTIEGKPFGGADGVLFSPDGQHYAYAARKGQEVVIVQDGKEIDRAPYNASVLNWGPLSYSAAGNHLTYALWNQQASGKYELTIDGKKQPPSGIAPQPVFSPDGSRYFYVAANPDNRNEQYLIVDGNKVEWGGNDIQFTADSKHIVCVGRSEGASEMQLLVDGKPAFGALAFSTIHIPAVGEKLIAVAQRPSPSGSMHFLVVDGQKVDASECLYGIDKVVFSPDGKRYAARCKGQTSAFMVIDGKKELEYQGIGDEMTFSPDGTRFAYYASNAARNFVVIDGTESNGHDMIFTKPTFSPDGKHVGFIAGVNRLNLEVIMDGKVVSKMTDAYKILYSQDGSRYAVLNTGPSNAAAVIDGEELKDIIPSDLQFSPDGKHLRIVGQRTKDRTNGVFIDGQLIFRQTSRFTRMPMFSPDSKHIYWVAMEVNAAVQPPRQSVLYVDGKPITKWNSDTNQLLEPMAETWEISPEGVLTTLVVTPEGAKRLRVTPDPAMSIPAVVENVKSAAAADAAAEAAAKQQAADAAAKAKADADAARLKAQQDAAKARAEAAAARQKAAAEAAARRAAQQQQQR